jgi:hypothetical protein
MNAVYALFWFDVEDCTVMQSDDCNKHLAHILRRHDAVGTFKIVGQKARVLEQHVRYDVIDALQGHDIGFHSNWHGLRPQIAEYLAPLGMAEGAAEFARREGPGLADVKRIFGPQVWTYGQPGSNWAPQVFSVLRQWGIPTYVSGFGYLGVDCQPFYLGNILCTSHMYGKRLDGSEQRHLMGLNFELGQPGEFEKHQALFGESLHQLANDGGLISIINHPCTLVLEEWFSTNMKSRELTAAGYRHFEEFVAWALSFTHVQAIGASRLPELYPDRAQGHWFTRDELIALAEAHSEEVNWARLGDVTVTAAEALYLLAAALAAYAQTGMAPSGQYWQFVDHPSEPAPETVTESTTPFADLAAAALALTADLQRTGRLPQAITVGSLNVLPADFLAAVARALVPILKGGTPPDSVPIRPTTRRFEDHVDQAAAQAAGGGAMAPPGGIDTSGLYELAKLCAWTVKPAVLRHM